MPLKVLKTAPRIVVTLHVGKFHARETVRTCDACHRSFASEELRNLVPSSSNFGYDVLVYVGRALFLRHRHSREVSDELAAQDIRISPSEVDYLGKKFIVYLAIAHRRCAPKVKEAMRMKGGYILHLDGMCDGEGPLLMSGLDSISQIVLGNVKLPSEKADQIVPFLEQIKEWFGDPVASVHDMGTGILKAIATVFPHKPDFAARGSGCFDNYPRPDTALIRRVLRQHVYNDHGRSWVRDVSDAAVRAGALFVLLSCEVRR